MLSRVRGRVKSVASVLSRGRKRASAIHLVMFPILRSYWIVRHETTKPVMVCVDLCRTVAKYWFISIYSTDPVDLTLQMMKQYPSGLPDSGWMKPAVVFVDNNDRYVRQWLTDCEKYSVHSVNSETSAPSSVSSHIYCEVEDADLKSETEIQRWSTWRTRVNEQLINNVLVVEQPEVESDAKENVPSSASCYQEASKSMRRSSTDLSLPDFTVYGIPRARLGK